MNCNSILPSKNALWAVTSICFYQPTKKWLWTASKRILPWKKSTCVDLIVILEWKESHSWAGFAIFFQIYLEVNIIYSIRICSEFHAWKLSTDNQGKPLQLPLHCLHLDSSSEHQHPQHASCNNWVKKEESVGQIHPLPPGSNSKENSATFAFGFSSLELMERFSLTDQSNSRTQFKLKIELNPFLGKSAP